MQLSNTSFNRDERHDPVSNSNRLARNKINLVELHDGRATFYRKIAPRSTDIFDGHACGETRRTGISDEVSAERRQESSVVSDSQIPSKRSGLYTDDSAIHQSRFKIHFDVRGSFFFAREIVRLTLSFLWKMFFDFS